MLFEEFCKTAQSNNSVEYLIATAYILTKIKIDTYYIVFNGDIQIIISWKMFYLKYFSLKHQGICL